MTELAIVASGVTGQGDRMAVPARYIAQVTRKMADGTYPLEEVRCPCGADFDDIPLIRHDRYFIPHRMVLCQACSLIRATPRMTAEAYRQFYNDEYRPIYDGWQFGEQATDADFLFMKQMDTGLKFKEFTDYYGIKAETVVDIGCNMGGMLVPFQEQGSTVTGVEVCERSLAVGRSHGVPIVRSLDELLARGVQADLVTMHDYIEHVLDLKEMEQVAALVKPDGFLYVGTPGLFRRPLGLLFQNAHVWQFIAATLAYTLSTFGFEEMYLDEEIASLWIKRDARAARVPKPTHWRKYILEHLEQKELRSMPPIRTVNKFTVPQLVGNLDKNLAHRRPDISAIARTKSGPIIVIGGGPSVDEQVEKIKALKADGAALIAIERMYPWCMQEGLTPDYVLSMDCSDGVEAGFTHLSKDTAHILASVTAPVLFDMLKGYPVYIFNGHTSSHVQIQNYWTKHGYTKATIVNTGGSVTLGACSVALTLGYSHLHVFGFDCMVSPERAYAKGIAGESVDRQYFPVKIEGRDYITCASFVSFAQSFLRMVRDGHACGMLKAVDVYGESLINKMFESSQVETNLITPH